MVKDPLTVSLGQVDRGRPHVMSVCVDILGCTLLSDPKHCVILAMGCHTCVKASCSLLSPNCSPELAHTHVVILLAAAQHLQTNATNNLTDTDSATGTRCRYWTRGGNENTLTPLFRCQLTIAVRISRSCELLS